MLFSQCNFKKHSESYTEKYNLDFKLSENRNITWTLDPFYPAEVKQDSSQSVHNKIPLCIYQRKLLGRNMKLQGRLYQNILLPNIKCDSITVHITCKSKNLKTAKLFITGLDKQEIILHKDSLSINGDEQWQTFSIAVSGKNVKLLNLTIASEGFNNFSEQKLYLDKIAIEIDKRNINQFPLYIVPSLLKLNKNNITSFSFSDKEAFNNNKWLKNKKVLAIGETIHGSKSIKKVVEQLIKEKIMLSNYKLILLELPMEQTLAINRYIHGDSAFNLEEAFENYRTNIIYPTNDLKELVLWMKVYNEKALNKVSFIGIDMDSRTNLSLPSIRDYFYRINIIQKQPVLDTLILKLKGIKELPIIISFLEKNDTIKLILAKNEYEIILHYLKTLERFNNDKTLPMYDLRDKYMFENAHFLINLLCTTDQKTIVHAHFGHTNSINRFSPKLSSRSLGYYMKNKYGNDYYSIAVLAGQGDFTTHTKDSLFVKRRLAIASNNSIEGALTIAENAYCGIPSSILPSDLMLTRHIGSNLLKKQFYVICPTSRAEAYFFIQNSRPFDIAKETPRITKEYNTFLMKKLMKHYEKYKTLKN